MYISCVKSLCKSQKCLHPWYASHTLEYRNVLHVQCALRLSLAYLHMLHQKGGTPLIMASQNGHLEVVQLLYREGKCNPHLKDEVSMCTEWPFAPLLLDVVFNWHTEPVGNRVLIKSFISLIWSNHTHHISRLCYARSYMHISCLHSVVLSRSSVLWSSACLSTLQKGCTASHLAVRKGHLAVLKFLIEECNCGAEEKTNVCKCILHMCRELKGCWLWLVVERLALDDKAHQQITSCCNGTFHS